MRSATGRVRIFRVAGESDDGALDKSDGTS